MCAREIKEKLGGGNQSGSNIRTLNSGVHGVFKDIQYLRTLRHTFIFTRFSILVKLIKKHVSFMHSHVKFFLSFIAYSSNWLNHHTPNKAHGRGSVKLQQHL